MRGLRTKTSDVFKHSLNLNYDIIILVETWLCEGICDSEIFSSNYIVYRKDRNTINSSKKRGGGVLIAIKSDIASALVKIPDNPCENIFVSVNSDSNQYIFGASYIPPNSPFEIYTHHISSLEFIMDRSPNAILCCVGDYNMPSIQWIRDGENKFLNVISTNSLWESQVCDNFNFINLYQFNHVANFNNVILDLVFSNCMDLVVTSENYSLVTPDEHHPPLLIQLPFSKFLPPLQNENTWRLNFRKANYDLINDFFISINWEHIFMDNPVDIIVSTFNDIIYSAFDLYVPKYHVNSGNFPIWYSMNTKKIIKQKNRAYNKYKNSNDLNFLNKYKELRLQAKNAIDHDYNNFIVYTQVNIQNNSKHFWRYINTKRKTTYIPNVMYYNDKMINNSLDICNSFAEFFSSVYTTYDKDSSVHYSSFFDNYNTLSTIEMNIDEIFQKLINLKERCNAGPDGIPPYFLKLCSPSLAMPISIIFQMSLNSGCFPQLWKSTFVFPLFKSNNKSDICNYRPICCFCCLGKIFESIIADCLLLNFKNVISQQQHGFYPGRSTETNLLLFTNFTVNCIENGGQVDTVYTDFRKAFDRVNHKLLIEKLHYYGIIGNLLLWLESYLTNRTQIVKIGSFSSYEIEVTSGVPQGSHLGPILFSLFINDISTSIQFCKYLLFADDLKLYINIKTDQDCVKLQQDINSLVNWCLLQNMELNYNKCKVITFHRKKNPIVNNYRIDNVQLVRVSHVNDLGIKLDFMLRLNLHIEDILTKCFRLCGFIKRQTRDFTNINSIILLYNSLIRSSLEYCCTIWSPHYETYINRLEAVQRKMCNYILFKLQIDKNNYSYVERLELLGFRTLQFRRQCKNIKYFHKLFNGKIDCCELVSLFNFRVPNYATRIVELLYSNRHRTNYGLHSPINEIIVSVNNLPNNFDIFNCSWYQLNELFRNILF